jgi:hypothetical protein
MVPFRRIIFFALLAGVCGLVLDTIFRPSIYLISSLLFITGVVSVFGLLVWSFVFLKAEPALTRITLVLAFVFILILCYLVATSPD